MSAKCRCNNQRYQPTHDLKDAFPNLKKNEYGDKKVAVILSALKESFTEEIFNSGVFKHEFGLAYIPLV